MPDPWYTIHLPGQSRGFSFKTSGHSISWLSQITLIDKRIDHAHREPYTPEQFLEECAETMFYITTMRETLGDLFVSTEHFAWLLRREACFGLPLSPGLRIDDTVLEMAWKKEQYDTPVYDR